VRHAGGLLGAHFFEQFAEQADHLDVLAFVVAADVVGLARRATFQDPNQGAGMVVDVEPVANLVALAVDRQRLAVQGVEDHQRDELLGKVIRAVVVRAIGGDHRQSVGVVPGAHQMVGRGLAGGIGGIGLVAGGFGEQAGVAQAAVDLVGGDVMEAEAGLALAFQAVPVVPGGFEQGVGADDVGLDEFGRAVDGAVDVALGGQVHDAVRLVLAEQAADLGGVADVDLLEGVARVAGDAGQGVEVACVGQAVHVDHPVVGVSDQVPDDGGADEAGAAGDEQGLVH
jgi:hypothetical protein